MVRFFGGIAASIAMVCVFCGCGPSESDILTEQTKKQIVEHYSDDGKTATFVKVHSFTQFSDADFMCEIIIRKGDKEFLTPTLMLKQVGDKVLISYPPGVRLDDSASSQLTEL